MQVVQPIETNKTVTIGYPSEQKGIILVDVLLYSAAESSILTLSSSQAIILFLFV
jgi:hypothetical protein